MEFGAIDVDELHFKFKTYQGQRLSNLEVFIEKLDDGSPRKPGTPPFFFSAEEINVADSKFQLIDENLQHQETLNFRDLNIEANDFRILGPEVRTNIKSLAFASKRGLEVKKLNTLFTYTKQQMRFDSLQINTPASHLKGNLIFNYDRKDFANFINKVNIEAQFADSEISSDEMNLLYNEFGSGKKIAFSSKINGVLNNLNAEDLFVQFENTGIRGNFTFESLFAKVEPFKLKGNIRNLTSNYYQLRSLLPNLLGKSLPSSFQKLGQFTIRGTTLITETSVDAQVNINTGIGSSYADLQLTNIDDIDDASYRGFVSFIDFDIGDFLEDKNFGKTTLDFNVEGRGFVQENLNTEVIGEVYALTFNGYEYKNLKVSGIIKDQLFDGSLNSNDDNVKFNFKGLADYGAGRNNFNFIASVDYADLKKLNFINDSISIFKGDINMDISGNSIDNFIGDIKFTQTNYQNKNDTYYFDDFKISSAFSEDTIRTIEINSPDIITGYLKGDFKIEELGKLVQNSVGSIYTNYRPFDISNGQRVGFNFKIYNKIVEVFFPEVKFGPNTFIRGNIIADEGDFKLTFKSPGIEAFGNKLDSIDVKVDNKNPLYNTFVSVADVSTNYYDVQDFNLINTTLNDTLFFRTEFKGGSELNDSYNLNFYHTFNNQKKSVIGLKTSDISFKGNTWILNKEGNSKNKVIINKTLDSINIEEIVMNNEQEEQIRLRGQLADSTYKDLELQFKIVSLNKITPDIDSLKLQGEVNGQLNILQKNNVYLPSSNLNILDFGVNDIPMGNLNIGIVGNKNLSDFVVNAQLKDGNRDRLGIFGNVALKEGTPIARLLVNFDDFDISPFNPLGEGIIDNIRGLISGNARVDGDLNNPDISGILTLNDAGIAIPYLNVNYDFGSFSRVRLYDQTFDFENIILQDIAENTKATLNGTIQHTAFDDWRLDLDVDTNNERFLILNTPFEEEVLYYGTGFLNGTGRIFGPTQALTIAVNGETARGTSLKIPISDVESVGDYSFINFKSKKRSRSAEQERILDSYEGLELNFDLDVTPEAEVQIVVDTKTGSTLKGTGEGLLRLEINTNGKFDMFGEFVVVTGEYRYKFGGLIDKTFTVEPGGNIVWEGDPLAAQLNMEATYALNANPAPLLDNPGYTRRIPTEVKVQLNGELESPEIAFKVDFPGTNSIVNSELQYSLQDPNVEERNAFSLLAQGTFINDNDGSGLNGLALAYDNLSQTGSGILNQLLKGDGGNDNFDFDLSYEQGDRNSVIQTENRFGVNISTKVSDRILINGRLGVPVGGGGVSETVVAGDVEVQILLNEEGTLSAKIFNRENEIQQFISDRQGYTQGVGLSYEVDFNDFKELMRKIFKKEAPAPTAVSEKPKKETKNTLGQDGFISLSKKGKDKK